MDNTTNTDTQVSHFQKGRATFDMLCDATMYGFHMRSILANPEARKHAVRLIQCIANETGVDHPLAAKWKESYENVFGKPTK